MKITIAALIPLLGAALASPTARQADTRYQIKGFNTRKPNGKKISTLSFRILATNGGTLDFECVPFDPVTQAATTHFEADHVYSCGVDSSFSFNFIPSKGKQKNQLFMWQTISDTVSYTGKTVFDDPICRAGGNGVNDLICTIPDVVKLYITLHQV